jgi:hypothetical protein
MTARCAYIAFALSLLSCLETTPGWAACETCATFAPAANWGSVTASGVTEASGIAASRRNPGGAVDSQ